MESMDQRSLPSISTTTSTAAVRLVQLGTKGWFPLVPPPGVLQMSLPKENITLHSSGRKAYHVNNITKYCPFPHIRI